MPDSRGLQPASSYAYALTEVCENVSELGGGDVALSLAVESLERLHEVGERADVRLRVDRLVDRQDLLELVLLLAWLTPPPAFAYQIFFKKKVAHTRLPSVGFQS